MVNSIEKHSFKISIGVAVVVSNGNSSYGVLTWATDQDTLIMIDEFIRIPGVKGRIIIGDTTTPIEAAYTAEIRANGTSTQAYIRCCGSYGSMNYCGASKTSMTTLTGTVAALGTSITVAAGWTNNFNGVANASIAKINGIAIADIAKVNGV